MKASVYSQRSTTKLALEIYYVLTKFICLKQKLLLRRSQISFHNTFQTQEALQTYLVQDIILKMQKGLQSPNQ